jgi:hypothetical protein
MIAHYRHGSAELDFHDRPHFYKYTTAATALAILKNCSVRWSAPARFNDPFDIQFDPRVPCTREEFSDAFRLGLKRALDEGRDTPINADNPVVHLFNQMARHVTSGPKGLSVEEFIEQLSPAFSESYDKMLSTLPMRQEEVRHALYDVCVFCVSEVPDNLLMWSHYSDSHHGILFKFKCLPEKDTALCVASKVTYTDNIPPFAPLDALIDSMVGSKPLNTRDIYYTLTTTKSREWEYEKEWRIVSTFRSEAEIAQGYADYPILPEEVEEITFGCRVSDDDRQQIANLVADRYPHVKLKEARKHPGKYALEFFDVK